MFIVRFCVGEFDINPLLMTKKYFENFSYYGVQIYMENNLPISR